MGRQASRVIALHPGVTGIGVQKPGVMEALSHSPSSSHSEHSLGLQLPGQGQGSEDGQSSEEPGS